MGVVSDQALQAWRCLRECKQTCTHCTSFLKTSSLAYTELAWIEQLDGTGGVVVDTSGVTTTSRLQTANEINYKRD